MQDRVKLFSVKKYIIKSQVLVVGIPRVLIQGEEGKTLENGRRNFLCMWEKPDRICIWGLILVKISIKKYQNLIKIH